MKVQKIKLVYDESTPGKKELSVPCAAERCSGCQHEGCGHDCHSR